MNAPPVLQSNKALPSLAKDKLPPPPPETDSSPQPPPPPKYILDPDTSLPSNGLRPPPIDVTLSDELLGQGLPFCLLPCLAFLILFASFYLDLDTPSGPLSSPASPDSRTKRANPLVDLIDSEKLYVDQLTGVIRVGYSSSFTGAIL